VNMLDRWPRASALSGDITTPAHSDTPCPNQLSTFPRREPWLPTSAQLFKLKKAAAKV